LNFKNIKAIVFDFDGVFTDNRVIISEDGKESVICNRADGIGLDMIRDLCIPMTIISTEKNPVVAHRAKKLKLPVVHGLKDKIKELENFSKALKIDFKNIAFLGNDVNDMECIKKVGFPIAVADAVEDIKKISSYVLNKNGGDGAVREFCELIHKSYEND
jgi:YrbI family 3-deoxy-D-manno-octulosonate 8-phosphate phosphatase